MAIETSVEPVVALPAANAAAPAPSVSADKAAPPPSPHKQLVDSNSNNSSSYENELDAEAEAEATLRYFALGLKQQADQLMRAERFNDALPLYRDALMHLSKSHVRLLQERELVVSCRMNALGAMSKLQQWALIPTEATKTMQVIVELERASKQRRGVVAKRTEPEDNNCNSVPNALSADEQMHQSMVVDALTRVHFFRGVAHFRLGSFRSADADFRKAMELSPGDAAFQDEYTQLQTAMQCEKRVKDLLNVARQHFQAGKPKLSIDCSLDALRECHKLQKDEFTGLVHGNLAAAYTKVGNDTQAIEHYKRALVIARKHHGATNTPTHHERTYDLLSALAACYSRRSDFSAAHATILEAIDLFPKCPTRRDLEAHLLLNAGRVSFTLHKLADAERYFVHAEAAASSFQQLALALTALLWLSKTCRQLGKDEQTVQALDKALAMCDKCATNEHTAVHDALLLAKLEVLDPVTNPTFAFGTYDSEPALWRILEHFERKATVRGELRAADVLVHWLHDAAVRKAAATRTTGTNRAEIATPYDDVTLNKLERVLFVVDRVAINKLSSTDDVATFLRLVLARVDLFVTKGQPAKAQAALVATLAALPATNDAFTQTMRKQALTRFAELYGAGTNDDDVDDMDANGAKLQQCVTNALAALRSDTNDSTSALVLCALLNKLAHDAARTRDVAYAQELLEESAALARRSRSASSSSEQLCGALVGLCVLHMKQRDTARAQALLHEIDALPCAKQWHELFAIKDELRVLSEIETRAAQAAAEQQRLVVERQQRYETSFAGWWDKWWFVVSVALVGAAVLLLQVLELQQKRQL